MYIDPSELDRVRRAVPTVPSTSDSAKLVNMDVWYATTLWLALISGWIDPASGRRSRSNPIGEIVVRPVVPPAILVPPSTDETYYVPNEPGRSAHPPLSPEPDHSIIYHPMSPNNHRLLKRNAGDTNVQSMKGHGNVNFHSTRYPSGSSAPLQQQAYLIPRTRNMGQYPQRLHTRMQIMNSEYNIPSDESQSWTSENRWNQFENDGQLPPITILQPPGQNYDPWGDIYETRQEQSNSQFADTWEDLYDTRQRVYSPKGQQIMSRVENAGFAEDRPYQSQFDPDLGNDFANGGPGFTYQLSLNPSHHHRVHDEPLVESSEDNNEPQHVKKHRKRPYTPPVSPYIPSKSRQHKSNEAAGTKRLPTKRDLLNFAVDSSEDTSEADSTESDTSATFGPRNLRKYRMHKHKHNSSPIKSGNAQYNSRGSYPRSYRPIVSPNEPRRRKQHAASHNNAYQPRYPYSRHSNRMITPDASYEEEIESERPFRSALNDDYSKDQYPDDVDDE